MASTVVRNEDASVKTDVLALASTRVLAPRYGVAVDAISKRLEEIRIQRGWSGREFSQRAGVSDGQYQKLKERGAANARSETLAAFAAAAGVSLAWLQTGAGSPSDGVEAVDPPAPADGTQVAPDVPLHDQAPTMMSQIPGYAALERAARKLAADLDEWVWLYLRTAKPLLDSRYPITPASLETLARAIAKHATPPANSTR